MNRDFERKAIEFALNRRALHGNPALDKFNSEQSDWYVTCPHCQANLRGTLAEIKEHSCGK